MRLTRKQKAILREVCEGNRDEHDQWTSWLDIRQLCDRVPYEVTKTAMKCSVRFLIEHGLVEKGPKELRRKQWVVPVVPSTEALEKFGRPSSPRRFAESFDGIIDYY